MGAGSSKNSVFSVVEEFSPIFSCKTALHQLISEINKNLDIFYYRDYNEFLIFNQFIIQNKKDKIKFK